MRRSANASAALASRKMHTVITNIQHKIAENYHVYTNSKCYTISHTHTHIHSPSLSLSLSHQYICSMERNFFSKHFQCIKSFIFHLNRFCSLTMNPFFLQQWFEICSGLVSRWKCLLVHSIAFSFTALYENAELDLAMTRTTCVLPFI